MIQGARTGARFGCQGRTLRGNKLAQRYFARRGRPDRVEVHNCANYFV